MIEPVVLDMTSVEVIQLLLNFTPEVGEDSTKIAVTLTMRLLVTPAVSVILKLAVTLFFCIVPEEPSKI